MPSEIYLTLFTTRMGKIYSCPCGLPNVIDESHFKSLILVV